MSVVAVAVWNIIALETPRVVRRCPRCDEERRFVSSDRFRVNANQRKLDVWLIYRCADCDTSWNCEVMARATPEQIGTARLASFTHNDVDAAWACAFDASLIARAGARVDPCVRYRVERAGDAATVRVVMPRPCGVRLDRLLAEQLGRSRTAIARAVAAGLIVTEPAGHSLRDPVVDGLVVNQRLGLAADDDAVALGRDD